MWVRISWWRRSHSITANVEIPKDGVKLSRYLETIIKELSLKSPTYPQEKITTKGGYTEATFTIVAAAIAVFMGTWCSDSRKHTPRLYRILDELKFNNENLEVHTVGIHPGEFRKTHDGMAQKNRNIYRVPTVIVSRNPNTA